MSELNEGGVPLDFSPARVVQDDTGPLITAPPKYSDDALALRFADRHASSARFVNTWAQWLHYDGTRWARDTDRKFFDMSRAICREAADEYLTVEQKASENVAKQLASAKTVAAVVNMASSDRRLAATSEYWDRDKLLLNTPAGTFDLKTGAMREHRAGDYLTKMTAIAPADEASCPHFAAFLNRVTGHDEQLIRYLQRVLGYCLTGETTEHAFFFLFGTGANGKSTFVNTVLGILGEYAQIAATETFTETRNGIERHPTELAKLRGARLVVASEVESRARWAESKIKTLTGGDQITARFMRQDFFEFTPEFKLMISGNHKPTLRTTDEAMKRRLHLIPFTVTIPENERDTQLPARLRKEWPAILRWIIDGCLAWQREGLKPPKVVQDATSDYLASQDSIGRWLEECCFVSPQAGSTKASKLHASYKQWAEAGNESAISLTKFGDALSDRGFQKRISNGVQVEGIAIRQE